MNARRFRLLCVALLLGGGFLWYRGLLRPEPQRLEAWATAALKDVFGPEMTHGQVSVDVLEGVTISELRVPSHDGPGDALYAQQVEIQHDALAMTAGVYRVRRIVLRGPLISTHELGHSLGTLSDEYPYSLRDVVRPCYTCLLYTSDAADE